MFGTPSSTPAFGGGGAATPSFATPSFATPSFATHSSTPAFYTPSPSPMPFGAATPAFGTPSTPAFATATPSPFFQPSTPQQQPAAAFGQQSPFAGRQIITQMAPVAPLSLSLADRDVQAIVDAYREEPGNPKYSFRDLLFSVTDAAARVKPVGTSDIMWAEAMGKLEGMDSTYRERLWPQLVQGFKDLSARLKLQDEVIVSDTDRLKMTQINVKMLQRHLQADILPWIQRLRLEEQGLQRRLLRVMRIVEALQGRGFRVPLMKEEAELAEKLTSVVKQLKGPGAELSRRVHNLLSLCRVYGNVGVGGTVYHPWSAKIDEQSLVDLQEVVQQQTEAIARLGNVLKRDTRDMEIIMSEGSDMVESSNGRRVLKSY